MKQTSRPWATLRQIKARSGQLQASCGLLWKKGRDAEPDKPAPARRRSVGTAERIVRMSVIKRRNTKYVLPLSPALAPPTPEPGPLFGGPFHREFIGASRVISCCRSRLLFFEGRAIASDWHGPPALDHLAAHSSGDPVALSRKRPRGASRLGN